MMPETCWDRSLIINNEIICILLVLSLHLSLQHFLSLAFSLILYLHSPTAFFPKRQYSIFSRYRPILEHWVPLRLKLKKLMRAFTPEVISILKISRSSRIITLKNLMFNKNTIAIAWKPYYLILKEPHIVLYFLRILTGSQLVKKFPTFYGIRRFITALTSVNYLPLAPFHSLKIHFNIILQSMPWSSKWSHFPGLRHPTYLWPSPLPHTCYVLRPSNSSWFDHPQSPFG